MALASSLRTRRRGSYFSTACRPSESIPVVLFPVAFLPTDQKSTIECPADVPLEHRGEGLVLTSPLLAGEDVVCNGTYVLTTEDVDNLMRASSVTVDAKDRYHYVVSATVDEAVALDQVSDANSFTVRTAC